MIGDAFNGLARVIVEAIGNAFAGLVAAIGNAFVGLAHFIK